MLRHCNCTPSQTVLLLLLTCSRGNRKFTVVAFYIRESLNYSILKVFTKSENIIISKYKCITSVMKQKKWGFECCCKMLLCSKTHQVVRQRRTCHHSHGICRWALNVAVKCCYAQRHIRGLDNTEHVIILMIYADQ